MNWDIIKEYIMKNTSLSELMCPELYEDPFSVYMHIYSNKLFIDDIEWQHVMYITYIAMVVLKIGKSLRVMEQVLFMDEDTPRSLVCRVITICQSEFLTFDFKEYIMDRDKITEVQFKQKCIEVCSKWYKPTTMALLLKEFKQDNEEDIVL
jgi:hypothetical protein